MNTKVRACVVVSACLGAFGCGESVTGPGDVTGTTWLLQSLQRTEASVVPAPRTGTFTLRFVDDGRLEVRADCNSCGGTFQLSGAMLSVGPLACTRVFCPSAPFDTEYVLLVEAATTVERADETLVLRSPAGVVRLVR